jgi:hypothetical protein
MLGPSLRRSAAVQKETGPKKTLIPTGFPLFSHFSPQRAGKIFSSKMERISHDPT